ncbi:hypothetical protein BRM3_01050 [Brachybacterium huguangmaarense]|uniref:Uncharacterized protein n=1 Tax=Brachybacterium huguangmaarense TaxID=1652028 RepID=A0ABY6G348_9MICO|nr:hypothetical protein [Brachybacterium huguangmaarense]UYG17056.1 hypothetical protein BRM3_01050 [Brachybacterium huguangmaarense]
MRPSEGGEPAPAEPPAPSTRAGASGSRRVVVSSITGRPMSWDDPEAARRLRPDDAPVLPDRLHDEGPEPGADESNDARIARDVPPHWGTGA